MRIALYIAAAVAALMNVSSASASANGNRCDQLAPATHSQYFTDEYKVDVYQGPKASPRLERGTWEWEYRTQIREGAKCPINFASQYNLIFWGQGTEAKVGVLVDAITGKVHQLKPARWEYVFHPRYNALVVDPDVPDFADPATPSHLQVWKWDSGWVSVNVTDTLITGSVQTWQAIAYNQVGDKYLASGFATPHEAMQIARDECTALYGDCNTGVYVPSDWKVHLGYCSAAKHAYVSLAVSPDGKRPFGDVRLDELTPDEASSCEPVFTH